MINFEIYTDGAWKKGVGSWAFVIIRDGKIVSENSGRRRKTCSTEMEFCAVIEALKRIPSKSRATLYTDSQILLKNLKSANETWSELADEVLTLARGHDLEWKWVRAHSGNPFNERCDELCVLARASG